MFKKIKEWIRAKIDYLMNAVVEIKMWLFMLLMGISVASVTKTAISVLAQAPQIFLVVLTLGGLILSLLISLAVSELLYFGVKRAAYRKSWKEV